MNNSKEVQLTNGDYGHFLHTTQSISHDDEWIVYDVRNHDPDISKTCCIEIVNTKTKEIKEIYKAPGQTIHGPGVGAAAFNPKKNQAVFIHGLLNSNAEKPYGFTRRTGVSIFLDEPNKPVFMDARDIEEPFTEGAHRGGSHVHTWSADGKWISYTYNDEVLRQNELNNIESEKDLRVIGIMVPQGKVDTNGADNGEQVNGEMFTAIVTKLHDNPVPGSDEIIKAYEDGWVGESGYTKENGDHQNRAIAFIGDVTSKEGKVYPEVFIVDLPDEIMAESSEKPLEGTATTRMNPPSGVEQRRLTFTQDNMFPGVQGPRHWLRSSPDGSEIFFLMQDENEIIQIYSVSPNGGKINQKTDLDHSVETTFNISSDGKGIVFGSQNKIMLTNTETGKTTAVTDDPGEKFTELRAPSFFNNSNSILYNRKVATKDSAYFQIFKIDF